MKNYFQVRKAILKNVTIFIVVVYFLCLLSAFQFRGFFGVNFFIIFILAALICLVLAC